MRPRLTRVLLPLLALLALALPAAESRAQSGTMFNQRDDKYRLLGLKRAKEAYEVARAEFDRQKELFDKKMVTQADLDRAKANMSDAEVNYQQIDQYGVGYPRVKCP